MFRALADAGINIQMITTSEIKISVLVSRDQSQQALRIVHSAFDLEREPPEPIPPWTGRAAASDAAEVVARLQSMNMEDLTIDDVALDATQARVTIQRRAGQAGHCRQGLRGGRRRGRVRRYDRPEPPLGRRLGHAQLHRPREQLDQAVAEAQKVAKTLGCQRVTSSPSIAKLSVSGVGLRTHTGVAIRMFKALADAGINLEMINTSEVRVNVVVNGSAGERGLAQLQSAFADVLR
jgi:aspartate kinase